MPQNDASQLKILFTGDIYPDKFEVSEPLMDIFSKADVRIGNLEGVIADFDYSDSADDKTTLPCIALEDAGFLKKLKLDYVSLANNHMFDYGIKGLHSNMKILGDLGIAYSGSGDDIVQARRPYIFEKNGIKVAIVSCAWDGTEALYAGEDSEGCAGLDEQWLFELPAKLKADGVNHVILYVHWGYCGYSYPMPRHKELGEEFAAKGYSAVIGHHNHQLQGMETVDGVPVFYGLGDFAFTPYLPSAGKHVLQEPIHCESLVVELTLTGDKVVGHNISFTRQNGTIIEADERVVRSRRFDKISQKLAIEPYEKVWKYAVRARLFKRLAFWLNPINWRSFNPRTFNAFLLMIKHILNPRSAEK